MLSGDCLRGKICCLSSTNGDPAAVVREVLATPITANGGPPFTTRRYLFLARASRVIMSKITVAAASAVTSAWS
jgi:hypothetical protein